MSIFYGTFAFKQAIRSYAMCGYIKLLTYLNFTAEKFKSYKNLKAHGYSVSRKIGSTKNFTVNFNPDIYTALKA